MEWTLYEDVLRRVGSNDHNWNSKWKEKEKNDQGWLQWTECAPHKYFPIPPRASIFNISGSYTVYPCFLNDGLFSLPSLSQTCLSRIVLRMKNFAKKVSLKVVWQVCSIRLKCKSTTLGTLKTKIPSCILENMNAIFSFVNRLVSYSNKMSTPPFPKKLGCMDFF